MIERIDINATKLEVDDDLKNHINRKLGKLDKYLPRHARRSAHLKVFMSESKGKLKEPTCEVVMEVPNKTLTAKVSAKSAYAAVDLVSAKLNTQLRKYKDTRKSDYGRKSIRRMLGKGVRT